MDVTGALNIAIRSRLTSIRAWRSTPRTTCGTLNSARLLVLLGRAQQVLGVDLGRALEGAGARTLIALNSLDALSLVKSPELSAAVLDLAQSTKDRHRFATRLKMLTIPFVFGKTSNVRGLGRTQPC
jgi:hypothetical protein